MRFASDWKMFNSLAGYVDNGEPLVMVSKATQFKLGSFIASFLIHVQRFLYLHIMLSHGLHFGLQK